MIHYTNRKNNAYGVVSLTLDTEDDVQNLPVNCGVGSVAHVIETSNYYMMNSQKQWKKQKRASGGNGILGDDFDPETDILVYDGGEV